MKGLFLPTLPKTVAKVTMQTKLKHPTHWIYHSEEGVNNKKLKRRTWANLAWTWAWVLVSEQVGVATSHTRIFSHVCALHANGLFTCMCAHGHIHDAHAHTHASTHARRTHMHARARSHVCFDTHNFGPAQHYRRRERHARTKMGHDHDDSGPSIRRLNVCPGS